MKAVEIHFTTEANLRAYCEQYATAIFTRALRDGRWGALALADLPADEREATIARWCAERRIPARMLSGKERAELTGRQAFEAGMQLGEFFNKEQEDKKS